MTMNDSKSTINFSNKNLVAYGCSYISMFSTWNPDDAVSIITAYVITVVACPLTILFNTLIIMAVAKNQSLQKNHNILISSLAASDLLVGAVSQPLCIVRGAFDFHLDNPPEFLCTLDLMIIFVLYAASCTSVCHLMAIAWERNTRISEDMNYPTGVTRKRIKMLIFVSWISTFVFVSPGLLYSAGVNHKYITPLDISIVVIVIILLFLIVYCYISIYIKIRKVKRYPTNANISQMAMAKYEKRIAVTTGLLTTALLIFHTPLISMILFKDFFPVLRGSSFFFWSMTLTELNSLANPLLYCCRNRQMKHAMLELLGREIIEINRNAIHPANNIQLQDARLYHVHELVQVVQRD